MQDCSSFTLICLRCDSLGIAADYQELAPDTTVIRCGNCGNPRGTLGGLRNLANSGRSDAFASETGPECHPEGHPTHHPNPSISRSASEGCTSSLAIAAVQ
jgi:hypothetical protein